MSSIKNNKCNVEGCDNLIDYRGMCHEHYTESIKTNISKKKIIGCVIKDCLNKHHCKGYCKVHYLRIMRHGTSDRIYQDHGARHTAEYSTWCSMKQRCFNKNNTAYNDYGGRGITMAKEWQNNFLEFYKYMGDRPSDQYSIERIDVNGNYEPGNVIWSVRSVQNHNQRIRSTNTSGYRGIHWRKDSKKWAASISRDGKSHHLGLFDTPEAASEAYQNASIELFSQSEHIALLKPKDNIKSKDEIDAKQRKNILNKIGKGKTVDLCWEWKGRIGNSGYGAVYFNGTTCTAHRAVYEILEGEIPGEMQLNHLCHNRDNNCKGGRTCLHRRCVNPSHMSLLTPKENLLLDNTASTINSKKTHCINGHEFTPENTRISYSTGSKVRFCKECDKTSAVRQKEQRRKIMEEGGENLDPRTLGKTHCRNGHELTDDTIKYNNKGYYYCTICEKANQERRKARRHEKILAEGREIRTGPKLKTHCAQGHPFDKANTYINPSNGGHYCRICMARYAREQRIKKRSSH